MINLDRYTNAELEEMLPADCDHFNAVAGNYWTSCPDCGAYEEFPEEGA